MKKIFGLLVFSLFSLVANSQIIDFKDDNFKAKLLEANKTNFIAKSVDEGYVKIDTDGDGEISVQEAQKIRGLNLAHSSINDVSGIEFFINLHELILTNNLLTSIDVSNSHLYVLRIGKNKLTSIDLKNQSSLGILEVAENELTSIELPKYSINQHWELYDNKLTSIDLSSYQDIMRISLDDNNLTYINIKNNTDNSKDGFLGEQITFSGNANLKHVCVDAFELDYYQKTIVAYGNTDVELFTDCPVLSTIGFNFSENLQLYPNPVQNRLTIESKNGTTIEMVEIYSLQGHLLQRIVPVSESYFDVSNLLKGIYIVKVITNQGITTTKLFKE